MAQPGSQLLWKGYLLGAILATAVYSVWPADSWAQTSWNVLVGYSAVAAVLVGVYRHRPPVAAAWLWFSLGMFLNTTGILTEAVVIRVLHQDSSPSLADAFYLGIYPTAAIGLALLIRRRVARRDWAALVDATTISTGLGLLSWIYLIRPAAEDQTLSILGHAASVAYPIGDVLLLSLMIRLLLGSVNRSPADRMVTASLLLILAGDVSWAVVNQLGWVVGPNSTRLLHMAFMLAYVLLGAAALHPSVRAVGDGVPRHPRLSLGLLMLLTLASLTAPAVLTIQALGGDITDGLAIAIGSVALFLLVVTRMAQLLRQVEQQAAKLLELSQVDELTGLANRRALATELPRAIERARRDHVPLSIAMLDLDHFKRFNDEYGHPAGDRLLRSAAAAWRDQLREVDQLARYGGEEFIVLIPGAEAGWAAEVLARLQRATPLGQTFSAGLTTWDGVETSDEMIIRADLALYEAKHSGRNRIVVTTAPGETDPAAAPVAR